MIKIGDLVFEYPASRAPESLAKCIESDGPRHRPYSRLGGSGGGVEWAFARIQRRVG
jgi:hypothetical protein